MTDSAITKKTQALYLDPAAGFNHTRGMRRGWL